MYYIFSVCVRDLSYSVRKSCTPYYIFICDLPGTTMSFHIISLKARFRGNVIEHKMCFVILFKKIV